jgi:hypothetical protein
MNNERSKYSMTTPTPKRSIDTTHYNSNTDYWGLRLKNFNVQPSMPQPQPHYFGKRVSKKKANGIKRSTKRG